MTALSFTPRADNSPKYIKEIGDRLPQIFDAARAYISSATAAHTVSVLNEVVLCDATSAAFAVTLPPAKDFNKGRCYIKKVDASANSITITPQSGETVDGAALRSISIQWESLTLVSNGTAWYVI